MPAHSRSRYGRLRVVGIPHKSRGYVNGLPFRIVTVPIQPSGEGVYQPQSDEYYDQISLRVYKTPHLWHLIAERNPSLTWPINVQIEQPLAIPSYEMSRAF
jgi:hypothetical protein